MNLLGFLTYSFKVLSSVSKSPSLYLVSELAIIVMLESVLFDEENVSKSGTISIPGTLNSSNSF